jgi:hypothetical protein
MKQFEYRNELVEGLGYSTDEEATVALNRFGKDGWKVFQMFVAGANARVWMLREIVDT